MTNTNPNNKTTSQKLSASERLAKEMRELNQRALQLFIAATDDEEAKQLWAIANAAGRLGLRVGRAS